MPSLSGVRSSVCAQPWRMGGFFWMGCNLGIVPACVASKPGSLLQCLPEALSSTKHLDSWDYHGAPSDVPLSGSPNSNSPRHSRAIFCPGDIQVQGDEIYLGECENFPSL